jgi:hypothetical protein
MGELLGKSSTKVLPVIATATALALIAVAPAESLAAPASKEYTPRVPNSKGEEARKPVPAAEDASLPANAIANELVPSSYEKPKITATVDLGDDDRSWLTALLDALLDPLVIAVALAVLAITAGAFRLRSAT